MSPLSLLHGVDLTTGLTAGDPSRSATISQHIHDALPAYARSCMTGSSVYGLAIAEGR